MNKYLSVKLKVISFLLMIMVVFLHSYNVVTTLTTGNIEVSNGYSSFIQSFFSYGICTIAVPLFFIISGYLFFLNIQGKPNEFILKFRKRIKTLVLPYLFWSIFGLLFYFLLQILPQSKVFFTNKLISDFSISELFSTIFFNPLPYQLWFIRDLVVLVILSPMIYWLIRFLNYFIVIVLLLTWIMSFDFIVLSNESLLFFVVGSFLSIKKIDLIHLQYSSKAWIYILLWVVFVFSKTLLGFEGFQNILIIDIIGKTGILIGLWAVWTLFDFLYKNKDLTTSKFFTLVSFSFFLYVFHEPILTMIKKVLFVLVGGSEISSLLVYIFAPLLAISISIFIGYYLKKIIPAFYSILTGGR